MIRTSLNTDSDDSLPTVLIALDVDGVLNRIPESRVAPVDAVWIVRRNGEGYWIDAPQLGWLTTWGDDVDLLVEGAFAGLLAGGNVIASRPDEIFVPIDWKLRALLEHLDQIGNPSYVWADDDAVAEALLFRPSFADSSGRGGGPRLLIDTAPQTGLTMSDVDRIRAFIDTHS
jgi:hypothetical protein